jgi:transcriptional regulator NrdR family protein
MKCPLCLHGKSKVVDTRTPYRRHSCLSCTVRWSTIEILLPGTVSEKKEIRKKGDFLNNSEAQKGWLQRILDRLDV